nr:carboxypeptidase regulatory-like domain-containing protein [uncultured Noviherbaspirillum sp.]
MFKALQCLLFAGLAFSTAATAQTPDAPVEPRTENGLRYLCGGVGLDESEYMKSQARSHGLLMTFATTDGSYLAKVHVDIADSRGKPLMSVDCDAPMLLVDLPRGNRYRILAQTAGASLSRTASVKAGGGNRVVFVWPIQDNQSEKPTRAEKRGQSEAEGRGASHDEPRLRTQSEMGK